MPSRGRRALAGGLTSVSNLLGDMINRQIQSRLTGERQEELARVRGEIERAQQEQEARFETARRREQSLETSMRSLLEGNITPEQFQASVSMIFQGNIPFELGDLVQRGVALQPSTARRTELALADAGPDATEGEIRTALLGRDVRSAAEGFWGPLEGPVSAALGAPAARFAKLKEEAEPVIENVRGPSPIPGDPTVAGRQAVDRYTGDPVGRFWPTEQSLSEQIAETIRTTEDTGPALAAQEGRTALARLKAEFAPDIVMKRIAEGVAIAQAATRLEISEEQRKATEAAQIASASMAPNFQKLIDLSDRLNTAEQGGPLQRVRGLGRRVAATVGLAPDVVEMQQIIAGMIRPIAIANGMLEANISEGEQSRALEMIGFTDLSTREERNNALRNIRDVMNLSPVMLRQVPPGLPFSERIRFMLGSVEATRRIEQEAIQSGDTHFFDPVTRTIQPVIN